MAIPVAEPHEFACLDSLGKICSGSDQFGTLRRELYRADMFCAPATKRPGFKPLKVPLGANHLTCYHTDGATINATRRIADQLELPS